MEQAGEGRRVWRRSGKCSHQPQEVGLELKSDLRESKAVTTKFYLHKLRAPSTRASRLCFFFARVHCASARAGALKGSGIKPTTR